MLLISGRTSTPSQPWFSVCENKHKVYQEEAEVAVLEGIGKQILTPEAVDYVVGQALQNLKQAMKRPDNRQEQIKGLQADLTESKRILERLSQALVNANTPLDTVLEMLAKQEGIKKKLELELENLQRVIRPSTFDEKRLRTLLASRMAVLPRIDAWRCRYSPQSSFRVA